MVRDTWIVIQDTWYVYPSIVNKHFYTTFKPSSRHWLTVPVFIAIVYGVWKFEDRFVTAAELEEVIEATQGEHDKIYLQMDVAQQRVLLKSEFEFRRMVQENPDNADFKAALTEIQEERKQVRGRIDERLRR